MVLTQDVFFVFFFFSSRRRHTRCSRDWSSDVCSSDLGVRSRVGVDLAAVPGSRDDRTVPHDRGPDRDVAMLPRPTRFRQSLVHETVVVDRPSDATCVREWEAAVWSLPHTPRYRASTSRSAASSAGVPEKTIMPLFMTSTR